MSQLEGLKLSKNYALLHCHINLGSRSKCHDLEGLLLMSQLVGFKKSKVSLKILFIVKSMKGVNQNVTF